ncbi:hypothetical protein IG631_24029 [Alternaria alternata]|nr:hypothetical protein IG631_24029 [Alternaria alternata]
MAVFALDSPKLSSIMHQPLLLWSNALHRRQAGALFLDYNKIYAVHRQITILQDASKCSETCRRSEARK